MRVALFKFGTHYASSTKVYNVYVLSLTVVTVTNSRELLEPFIPGIFVSYYDARVYDNFSGFYCINDKRTTIKL